MSYVLVNYAEILAQQEFEANHEPVTVNGYRVELLGANMATITDNETRLAVTDYYCAHCATNGDGSDGEGPCAHKDALFEAMDAADLDAWRDYRDEVEQAHAASRGVL